MLISNNIDILYSHQESNTYDTYYIIFKIIIVFENKLDLSL